MNCLLLFHILVLGNICGLCQVIEISDDHESEAETISKCIVDLTSDSELMRKRAILILGKYDNPLANDGVIRSLGDSSPDIRRSALVSLTEKRRLPANASLSMLRMIGDSDVHIRRIASSYLPQILRYGGISNIFSQSRQNVHSSNDLEAIILRAFADDDVTVRRNMMNHFMLFQSVLNHDLLTRLLTDEDREVRILALNASRRLASPDNYLKLAGTLIADPDREIRLTLTKSLIKFNQIAAVKLLEKLASDNDFEVSTEALIALLKQPDFSYYKELRKRLDDPRMGVHSAHKIISELTRFGENGRLALRELINHDRIAYRKVALETYGNRYGQTADKVLLFTQLNDPARRLRDIAGKILLRQAEVSSADLSELARNRHADVRIIAVILSRRLGKADVEQILFDLLLDENSEVRLSALREIVRKKFDGWETVVRQTLDEDDVRFRQETINVLLKSRSKLLILTLAKIARETDDNELRGMIHARIGTPGKR